MCCLKIVYSPIEKICFYQWFNVFLEKLQKGKGKTLPLTSLCRINILLIYIEKYIKAHITSNFTII